jgi:ankyrin repeat protein
VPIPSSRLSLSVCVVLSVVLPGAVGSAHSPVDDVPLIEAVKEGNAAVVRAVLAGQVDVDGSEPDGTTALHWAAHLGDAASVELLLDAGADLRATTRNGATPYSLAAYKAHAAVLVLLLEAGEDANAVINGEPVLMMVARAGNPDAVRALLLHGADPNVAEPIRGQTPLMHAAAEGNVEAMKVLLYEGSPTTDFRADVDARSTGPSEKPRIGGRIPRINDPLGLRAHRDPTWAVNMDGWEMSPINWASRQGHQVAVAELLAAGADVNDPKTDGRTNLILAIENRHYELAGYLLDQGADPNLGPGYTALHQIAWTRRLNAKFGPLNPQPTGALDSFDLVKKILDKGVDIDAQMEISFQDGYRNRMIRIGATAFLLSSKLVDLPMMKLLVEHGADIQILNRDNDTPLILATGGSTLNPNEDAGTEEEALAAVKYLVEELEFDVNAVNVNGETPMFGPSYRGWNGVARYLANQGAELGAENVLGWTPTTLADGVFFAGFFKAQPQTATLLREIYRERGLTPPEPPKLNDTSLLTVGSSFARGDIVVEPSQGDYMKVDSLEGAEFPLLVVTGVDAQGQVSGTEPYDPDGR